MNVNEIREMYPKDTRLILKEMANEPQMKEGLKGSVDHVDDSGQIHMKWENGSSLALNIDEDKFNYLIEVLLVEPDKYPKVIEISDDLETMQSVVGGYIEEYMPFDDEVAIVCNEEGKINGEPLNRAIYDMTKDKDDPKILDVIAGRFFICHAPVDSERYKSLSKEDQQKYYDLFKYPEHFMIENNKIKAMPYKPISRQNER